MLKSLYMKLVLILLLLIVSLMAVTGAVLNSAVAGFFINEFNTQMETAFSNADFIQTLREAAVIPDAAGAIFSRVQTYNDSLGISANRRAYILDGRTGELLYSEKPEDSIDLTPNIITALRGEPGSVQRLGYDYFDCAVPLVTDAAGSFSYIVYIRDLKQGLASQSRDLFFVILQAVLIGMTISLLLSLLLSRTITAPIKDLTQGAARLASGDFSSKLEVHSRDEIGVLTGAFNHMADVLRESTQATEGERDKLSALFLHMTDGVAAFSHEGDLQRVNLAALRLLGMRENDLLTYDRFEHIVPFAEAGALKPPNYLVRDMRAGTRDLKLYFVPYGTVAEGGLMVVLHDFTEMNRLEGLRREFVSNVSHELRTPLTGIKSYAETLMEPEGLTHEEITRFSSVIVDEADRMTRLVHDLLTLSRFDYGKADWSAADFDISELLRRIHDLLRVEANSRHHKLSLSVASFSETVRGDRDQIEQVLINIITNAIRYTPDGGRIDIDANSSAGWVRISVRDNGIGIPEEDLPFIFERFYRVDKARSRSMGGTGLGLAIAREIVEKHKGRLVIESELGKGTTVSLLLPLKEDG
ncbi:MAG: cell wall metabolism sensor histidine kinase WalK [Oscillospiraceae bacterium]|jgi:two-component system sensor histidine kinase VicK|nr:cell wall metabolism sensor histidine kinase WalK [Oscillospiraceae bacterium]